MLVRGRLLARLAGLCLVGVATSAAAQDATICFTAAERIEAGETLSEEERTKAHEACQRALSDTASVVQKYQLQEADFAIMGQKPKE